VASCQAAIDQFVRPPIEIMAYLRNKSVEFLKTFEVPAKNPSEDAQRRWRDAVTLVKNRRRRFRMVPDLDKRWQVEAQRRQIQVRHPQQITALMLKYFSVIEFVHPN
jgi:hypothetical protein